MSNEGGIGEHDWQRMVPRDPDMNASTEGQRSSALTTQVAVAIQELYDENATLREHLAAQSDQIASQEQTIAQLRGQVARQEAALPQFNAAFQQLDARMNALAQHVMRNARFAALDMAARTRQPGEHREMVMKNAEAYLSFIDPPASPVEAPASAPVSLLPDGALTH